MIADYTQQRNLQRAVLQKIEQHGTASGPYGLRTDVEEQVVDDDEHAAGDSAALCVSNIQFSPAGLGAADHAERVQLEHAPRSRRR